jgi:AcrR family transcriptional regulator
MSKPAKPVAAGNAPSARQRGRPAILSRDEIVAAALAYASSNGLDKLSMRELSRHMKRPPMSLYAHLQNKEDLLVAMLDAVLAELKPSKIIKGDAKTALKRYLHALRKSLNTLPGLYNVAVVNGRMTAPMLGIFNVLLQFLSALDQPLKQRVNYSRLLVWMVLGFSASEASSTADLKKPNATDLFAAVDVLDADDHAHLLQALPLLMTPQPEKVFEMTVDLLVDGIWNNAKSGTVKEATRSRKQKT